VATVANIFVLAGSYILLALGWVLIFRATRIMNFATGEFMILGAYILYVLAVASHINTVLAIALALVISGVFGWACYVFLMRKMITQPLFSAVVLTLGLTTVMSGVIDIVAGPGDKVLPSTLANDVFQVAGARISVLGAATTVLALVLVGLLVVFFHTTSLGIQMRAAAESPALAARSGMNVSLIFGLSWALAGILTAIAGITFGYIQVISPQASQLGLDGIAPALVGGFESIGGTIPGAIIVATVQVLGVNLFGGASNDALAFTLLLFFVMVKPTGLFGSTEVGRL
jgi:branched-chain amino acid transport system permease protein